MNRPESTVAQDVGTTKRGVLVYIIGIIALVSAAVSLIFAAKDFYILFKAADMNFKSLAFAEVASVGIELVFSVLEITTGLSLIKQWHSGESIEMHKTLAKLMKVIVYESFLSALALEVVSYFVSGGNFIFSTNMVYIGAYFVYYIVMSSMSTFVKRNELMKLYYLMMFSAFIAIGFSAGETYASFIELDLLETGFGVGNVILTSLIFAFALSTVVYYVKNPEKLQVDVEASEDSELIRETETHRYLRVYSNRADETGINLAINLLYALAIILGCVAIVFFSIEQNVARFAGNTLGEVINNIRAEFNFASISSATNLLLIFYVFLVYPLSYVSAISGIFMRDSRTKISLVTLTSVGTGIMVLSNMFVIIEFVMDIFKNRSFDIKTIPISDLALIALFIVYTATQKLRKNKTADLYEGINQGDSYRSHIKQIHGTVLFNSVFSLISLALMFSSGLEADELNLSYPFFAASTALIALGTHLELKHPFAEYTKVKRRKTKSKIRESVERNNE